MDEQRLNANGDARVSRDYLNDERDSGDTELQVESSTSSPTAENIQEPDTPRKQLPTSSSPVQSEDTEREELQVERQERDQQHDHPRSPVKQAKAMDTGGYGSAQESSMMGDDTEDRAANASRPALNTQDRSNSSEDASPQKDDWRNGPGGPSYAVDSNDDSSVRIRQAEGETNQYSDEDDHTQSMMSQTTASAAKPKGKGRGKAAFPKGGENTPASAYTGHKIKHLKKEDGEPLWRKDIQYDFLDYIFRNDAQCFTNSYDETMPKQCFADLYIDTMARSSKTSKILREKLMSEREPAKNMAMVCLLVNLGRMNTTLNFFPEMRAQLRTYHAIPSLQAQQDPNSYKQLQDAPRLKSILKGASEDRLEPNTIDKIKDLPVPRTNPVNLIFVLAQYASRVTELHFPPGRDFYDLIMRPTLSSKSRGRAFLWLMWHYLESDFTEEGCNENPFGTGVDYQTGVSNQGVPSLHSLTEEAAEKENVDTPYEIEYGEEKRRERRIIIEADQAVLQRDFGPPKRGPKPKLNLEALGSAESPAALLKTGIRSKYDVEDAGGESGRSTPPRGFLPPGHRHKIGGVRVPAHVKYRLEESSPAPAAPSPHLAWEHPARRQRPLTAHQQAVEKSRNEHVNHILNKGLKKVHHEARKLRKTEGAILRAVQRTAVFQSMCEDSEDEENLKKHPGVFRERGMGGLVQVRAERDDFGEECGAYAMGLRRLGRRLDRWDAEDEGCSTGGRRERRAERQRKADEQDRQDMLYETPGPSNGNANGNSQRDDVEDGEEDLDDVEKTLLGLDGGEEEDEAADEDLDDVDKALLGLGGDESEEEDGGDRMDVS